MDSSISSYPSVSAFGASPEQLERELPTVDFFPAEIVRHRTAQWRGMLAKTVHSATSAFSAAFRRLTGQTPTDYRRSLE
jgi:hypothetical protein